MSVVNLGDRAKDSISGLKGIVVGVTEWLYGCRRVGIQPEALGKDGKVQDTAWFDEAQCEVVKPGAIKTPAFIPVRSPGGPNRHEEIR